MDNLDLNISIPSTKRQKLENESNEEEKKDNISKLPDEILSRILSLLPEEESQATCILSKTWKDRWAFLPDLRFIMPFCDNIVEGRKFMDFIERILILRKGRDIRKFSLFLRRYCNYDRVYDFICAVMKCKVQELNLQFPGERYRLFIFPWNHFIDCMSLVALTLRGQFVFDVPATVVFPSLKDLKLLSIIYSGDAAVENLFSGCPKLERLYVERHLELGMDNLKIFKVYVPSLKVLKTSFTYKFIGTCEFFLNTPNLEELQLVDRMSHTYAFVNLPFIVHAKLSLGNRYCIPAILKSISATKTLELHSSIISGLAVVNNIHHTPIFRSLVKLSLGYDGCKGWQILTLLLQKMPKLEHLIFNKGLVPPARYRDDSYHFDFVPLAFSPLCLANTLTKVEICNREALTSMELVLIKYFLMFGLVLQTVTINRHNIYPRLRNQLLGFLRASRSCQIYLI